MMRRFLIAIGLLLIPLTAAADQNVYKLFLNQVVDEKAVSEVEDTVALFLKGVYEDRWPLTQDEITAAVRGQPWKACTSDDEDAAQRNVTECGRAIENIQLLTKEEGALRLFGRDLQRLAASQELPISEIPGRPFHLATDLSGIINIWRAGTGSVKNTVSGATLIRTWAPEKESQVYKDLKKVIDDFVEEYSALNEEQRVAVVTRYQYGVRLVRGERNPTYPPPVPDLQSDPGTERQYVFKQWEKIEQILERAYNALPVGDTFKPPLSDNEVTYVLLPDDLKTALPDNILLWLRVGPYEQGNSGKEGDAGIVWEYPTEPLLPALLSDKDDERDKPILGGRYPPEPANAQFSDDNGNPTAPGAKQPIDGRGLCSMSLAQRGYLCRPLAAASETQCPDPEGSQRQDNVIRLISCTIGEAELTVAGADVCREIEWRIGQDQDARRCAVDPDEKSEYELVKAQQRCILKKDNPYAGLGEEQQNAFCCRLEGEAHLVACKAMAKDGFLQDADGNPLVIDELQVTPQICMEILRLESCEEALGRGVRCPVTRQTLTADDADAVREAREIEDPDKDLRIAARIRTIERQQPTCVPGTETTYKNTIGNNVCYVGQCVEESLELHRVTGGRSPATVGDEAFPWDNPDTGDALATVLRSVPAASPPLPSYRPQMVVKTLEDALCQLQGLPAATPPHLCAFAPSRRLALPLEDAATTVQNLIFNSEEQRDATLQTQELAAALASRIGTDMQGQYLRIGTRTLSEVVALANMLLKEAIGVKFPANMCPLSLGD